MEIMQVKLSGHSFLVFVNIDLSVLVRETFMKPIGKVCANRENNLAFYN